MNELIKALENYIKFLEEEINNEVVILHIHGITCSPEIIKKGEELRQIIIEEKNKVNKT